MRRWLVITKNRDKDLDARALTLRFSALDVGEYALVLRFCDLRALKGVVGEGISDLAGGLDLFLECLDEGVIDGFFD